MKRLSALLLLLSALTAFSQVSLTSGASSAGDGKWKMAKASDITASAENLSMPGYATDGWLEATVPGTVLTNLVANGIYPDPYFGKNNKLSETKIPDLAKVGRDFYTYWWRTEFSIPDSMRGKTIWLEPQGINYRAELWLNGHLVDVMAGMFKGDYINVTDYVNQSGTNALAIKVYPVDVPGSTKQKEWGATGEWRNGGDGEIGANTTQLMTVGWDFTFEDGIRDRNTGIWRPIILRATGPGAMRHPFVKSELSDSFRVARETVSVEVFNPSNINRYRTFKVVGNINPGNISFEKEITLDRGQHGTVEFSAADFPQLKIDNPLLWWPKNKGPQNLYDLSLKLYENGELSDSLALAFGIRDVKAVRDTPDGSKMFVINGVPTFIRGTNWIPEAMLRTDDQRMDTELAYTAQSGVNLLRLWGGGIAESNRFYELCDKYGILVWQEFWLTGDTRHPQDETLYLANLESTVKRIRNHPSIIFYVSSNESTEVSGAKELLTALDGTRPYQMQSECDGVHDGSPYKQVNPMQHYTNTASDRGSRVDGFNPEYGAPTLPLAESLRRMMPEDALWPIDVSTWDYLDGNGFHLMTKLYNDMVLQYGECDDIEQYAKQGQLVGAMNSKSIWETWNRNKLNYGDRFCSGLLFWYHNNPNPQVCARMWDWYLEPTASLYHTANALEPLHIQYDYLTNGISVVNDGLTPADGLTATATVYDLYSRKISEKKAGVDVAADGVVADFLTLDFPEDITPVHFISLALRDKAGKEISRNFYWRSTNTFEGPWTLTGPTTAGFGSLHEMPEAKIKTIKKQLPDGKYEVTVSNAGRNIAFFIQLQMQDEAGQAINSSHYSDNFFTLLPGEKQTVVIEAPQAGKIKLSGWNTKSGYL
ncbi:MAG: glycoside hydrolase family 2 [Bacteroidales bacterium]|nr:glycoside hydrolase family 2 [Bacteroidales bacterium]